MRSIDSSSGRSAGPASSSLKRVPGVRYCEPLYGDTSCTCGPRTRKAKLYGRSRRLPSSAWNAVAMVTVYVAPAASAAAGTKRIVTGSRHSSRPSTRGWMLKMARGSTDWSSPEATGRSNVTVIASVASPSRLGDTRTTRNGSTDTATAPSVNNRAARAENISATRGGGTP